MSDMPLVEVEWVDSQSRAYWQPRASALRWADGTWDAVHRTAGYLLADEPDYVAVAGSTSEPRDDDDREMVSDVTVIPRSAVTAGPRKLAAKAGRK